MGNVWVLSLCRMHGVAELEETRESTSRSNRVLINHSVGFYDGKQFARAITGRNVVLASFVDALIAASGARYYFHRVNAGCRLKIWKVNNSSSPAVIYRNIIPGNCVNSPPPRPSVG